MTMISLSASSAPLHFSCYESAYDDDAEAVMAACSDPNAHGEDGASMLHLSAALGHNKALLALVDKGFDVNRQTFKGLTPLQYTVAYTHLETIKILIKHGANVSTPDYRGYAAIHRASSNHHITAIRELLKAGADVNDANTKNGVTPLHIASYRYPSKVVAFLIANGANVSAQSINGSTPLHYAATAGLNPEIIRKLAAAGADLNHRENAGRSAMDIAKENDKSTCVEILKSLGAID